MDQVINWSEIGFQSLIALGESVMNKMPNLLGALFLIILGWVFANFIYFIVKGLLKAMGFNKLTQHLNVDEFFENAKFRITPIDFIAKFAYWVILLLFFVTATDTLGWGAVSNSISQLLTQLPLILSAIIIFLVGMFIITFLRNVIRGTLDSLNVSSSRLVSSVAYYILLVVLSVTSLEQAGVNTTLITSNVLVIFGGVMLAFAISFGIGSREILSNILSSFYTKKYFEIGQRVELNDVKGTIEKLESTSVLIKTDTTQVVIPIKRLIEEKVNIKK